jgi:3-hydroxyisobutyrate dehydrogenase-like beta-hydroxyacid dehydrogenase
VNIAFYGLGEMGFAMAGYLAGAGHAVKVIDLDTSRVNAWQSQFGAQQAGLPEVVVTTVTDAAALRALSASVAGHLNPGMLWIDHTTSDPETARHCAMLAAGRGAGFVEAPMSGGKDGAREGKLTLFVGATAEDAERARQVTAAYCAHFAHFGPVGAGQTAKLAHQLAVAGIVLGLEAARSYGASQGLATGQLLDALAHGTARSEQLRQHQAMIGAPDFDFVQGFAWLAKDLAVLPASQAGLPDQLRRLVAAPQASTA